jgi:hypothetical protein
MFLEFQNLRKITFGNCVWDLKCIMNGSNFEDDCEGDDDEKVEC